MIDSIPGRLLTEPIFLFSKGWTLVNQVGFPIHQAGFPSTFSGPPFASRPLQKIGDMGWAKP